jgi:S1-C subfamily serine protease
VTTIATTFVAARFRSPAHRAWAVACLLVVAAVGHAADEPTGAEEAAFRAAVDRVAAAVVRVEPAGISEASLTSAEVSPAAGPSTGLVLDADGWAVTTAFAVPADATAAVVVLADGRRLAARVQGRDLGRGLVLLKSDPVPGSPSLEAAPRDELAAGQWAIAVGRGWSHAAAGVSVGIVSAVSRAWGRAVQTDAAVSPANYGGPLVDIRGRVIGLLAPLPADTAGMKTGTELYDAGIGFAIPFDDVLRAVPRLKETATLSPGILGISYRSRDQINGEPVIGTVRQGSPAARAGLRPGDRIVRIADRDVTRIADVRHQVAPRYAGDTLDLVVSRSGDDKQPQRIDVRATLADSLPPWRQAVVGIVPEPLPPDAPAGPVAVAWILPDGPAAAAGLQEGDRLESIAAASDSGGERTVVDSPAALAGFLAGVEPGGRVELEYSRAGARQTASLVTSPPPTAVPPTAPEVRPAKGGPVGGDPLARPAAAVDVVRLEGPEIVKPPLAVLPKAAGKEPIGVLIHFGQPRAEAAEAEAEAWKAAAARYGVAVILPGSADAARWSLDDLPAIRRALASLNMKRKIDPARIAVSGRGSGGSFAWLVGERLGAVVRGVAVLDAVLPRQAAVDPVEPGRSRWVLLGDAPQDADGREPQGQEPKGQERAGPDRAGRLEADRRRLEAAGFPVGSIDVGGDPLPTEELCRWVSVLSLL